MKNPHTLPDGLLVYVGCRENKGNQLIHLAGQGQQIRSTMIGQIRSSLSIEADTPFPSKTLCPARNLVDKGRAEFADKATLSTHRKEFLTEIGPALNADHKGLTFIPQCGFGR